MIQSISKGRSFRGAANYVLEKEKARLIGGNMAGRTPRELATEARAFRELNPKLGRACFHASLSLADGEALSDEQWRKVAGQYMAAMGFESAPYFVARHQDTEHDHVHIVAVRIDKDGRTISDSQDYQRGAEAVQEIERDYGLVQGAKTPQEARERGRKAPTKGELQKSLRTGQESLRTRLQDLVQGAAQDRPTFTRFVERLEAAGVEVVPNVASTGYVSGISYRLGGELMKGSDLGKAFSFKGIQTKLGVGYEQDRDLTAVRAAGERAALRAFGLADRELEAGEGRERGGTGPADRAPGASDGGADRRDARDLDADPGRGQGRATGDDSTVAGGSDGLAQDGSPTPERGRGRPKGSAGPELAAVALQRADGGRYSGAVERILDLAGAAADRGGSAAPEVAGEHGRGPEPLLGAGAIPESESAAPERDRGFVPAARFDRTAGAVKRQLEAMGCERYELGIRDEASGRMLLRGPWNAAEVEKALPWLKRVNARGSHVYVRPAGPHDLALIDDLKADQVERLKALGLEPAVVVQTSPGNHQVWLKHGQVLTPEASTEMARSLARKIGGDPNSADWRHFGRLAGFTNAKEAYRDEGGRYPYALLLEAPGRPYRRSGEALERLARVREGRAAQAERARREKAIQEAPELSPSFPRPAGGRGVFGDPVQEYRRRARGVQAWVGARGLALDWSRVDFRVAKDMLKDGWGIAQVEEAIMQASPSIDTRKRGRVEGYAWTTAHNALREPEVQQALERRRLELGQAQNKGSTLER